MPSYARYILEKSIKDTIGPFVTSDGIVVDSVFMTEVLAKLRINLIEEIKNRKNPVKRWRMNNLINEVESMQKEYMRIPNT